MCSLTTQGFLIYIVSVLHTDDTGFKLLPYPIKRIIYRAVKNTVCVVKPKPVASTSQKSPVISSGFHSHSVLLFALVNT